MTDQINDDGLEVAGTTRRKLFRKSAEIAVTAPAVALLLNASVKKANAANLYAVDAGTSFSSADAADAPSGGLNPADDSFSDDFFINNADRP